ncbi:MAG TPA: hypothetical protein VGN63_14325 [Flavisolibacter sp.]|jgi:hypothetical protein|nr:hypothetical protein [Flavisolibacter sp.]
MATTNTTDFYRKPYLTTAAYALALLLFLLPFFDIKCNNISMAKLSGINMATGSKPSLSREMEDMQNSFPGERRRASASVDGEGQLFITALFALLLGVAGLLYSIFNKGENQRPGMYIGGLGALALIGSWIQVSSYVSENARSQGGPQPDDRFSAMINISASPTFWFILCLLLFLAAAFISYQKSKPAIAGTATADEKPPQAAPQIKIKNPGDQSEFPSSPEGERDLG